MSAAWKDDFLKAVELLNRAAVTARARYPRANLYLAADGLYMLSDDSHDEHGKPRQDRRLIKAALPHASGGDW